MVTRKDAYRIKFHLYLWTFIQNAMFLCATILLIFLLFQNNAPSICKVVAFCIATMHFLFSLLTFFMYRHNWTRYRIIIKKEKEMENLCPYYIDGDGNCRTEV